MTVFSATPSPIKAGQFVGPPAPTEKPPREHYSHALSETTSLIDAIFKKSVSTTPSKAAHLKKPENLIQEYASMIDEHFDRRIVLYIQQLCAVYGTRYHFEVGPTMNQGESATSLTLHEGIDSSKLCTRNAAHSSTFPCLIAYPLDAWEEHIAKGTPKPKGFVFLKDSDLYRGMNATIELPRDVNEADLALDGDHHDSPFSNLALHSLNTASKGKITPQQALIKFLEAAKTQVEEELLVVTKPGIKQSLTLYLKKIETVLDNVKKDSNWLFQQLDAPLETCSTSDKMKLMILRVRCKAIRTQQLKQAELADKVSQIKKEVFAALHLDRRPPYFENAFRYLVAEQMPTKDDKRRIQKFFALPPREHFIHDNNFRATLLAKTETLLRTQIHKINALSQELSTHMHYMRADEMTARGYALKLLRHGKGWTQKQLSREIKKLYPDEPSSGPTICRSERGYRPISNEYADKLTRTLNIPHCLIAPQFFNS